MENGPFIDDFPINTSIYKGFFHGFPWRTVSHNQRVMSENGFMTIPRMSGFHHSRWRKTIHFFKLGLNSGKRLHSELENHHL